MADIKCLVCDEVIRAGSGKDIFRKGAHGLRPLKERLQVVLQVNLDRRSSHSSRLCLACFKQLAVIDKYQCNIEYFSDTFQDATENRMEDSSNSHEADYRITQCFTCNGDLSSQRNIAAEDPNSKRYKTRLERVLSVNLDTEIDRLGGLQLCFVCTESLGALEKELEAVNDFSSRYRTTRGLYKDDDIDDDLVGMMDEQEEEDDDADDAEEEEDNADDNDDGSPKMSRTYANSQDMGIDYEGIKAAEKNIIRKGRGLYKCKRCGEDIQTLGAIRNHSLMHSNLNPFSCEKCGKAFLHRGSCRTHINNCDTQSTVNTGSRRYRTVLQQSGERLFECLVCGKIAETVSRICGHLNIHRLSSVQSNASDSDFVSGTTQTDNVWQDVPFPFVCNICREAFSTADRLSRHCRAKHGTSPSSSGGDVSEGLQGSLGDVWPNQIAKASLGSVSMLGSSNVDGMYRSSAVPPGYPSLLKTLTGRGSVMDGSPASGSLYQDEYDTSSTSVATINDFDDGDPTNPAYPHNDIVQLAGQFDQGASSMVPREVADALNKQKQYNKIKKHVGGHAVDKPFKCEYCPKCYSDLSSVRRHQQKNHHMEQDLSTPLIGYDSDACLHTCLVCPYAHSELDQVKQHIIVHFGENSSDSGNHSNHQQDMSASVQYDSQNHIYRCPLCVYEHKWLPRVVQHLRSHTGERPYTCQFCSKTFADSSNRKRHEKVQHGIKTLTPTFAETTRKAKPFQCDVCQVSFRYESTLKRHSDLHKEPASTSKTSVTESQHQLSTEQAFQCAICGSSFGYSMNLQGHYTVEHGDHPQVMQILLDMQANLQQRNDYPSLINILPWTQSEETGNADSGTGHYAKKAFECTIGQMSTGKYWCVLCADVRSYDLADIIKHQEDLHSQMELGKYKASIKNGDISLIKQDGPDFSCMICPLITSSLTKIQDHLEQFHFVSLNRSIAADSINRLSMKKPPNTLHYRCMFCPVTHRTTSILARHVKSKHPGKFTDVVPNNSTEKVSSQGRNLSYICIMCTHVFEEPGDLQVHFGEHVAGYVYPFTSSLRLQAVRLGATDFYSCQLCGATFVSQNNLDIHLSNHANIPIGQSNKQSSGITMFNCPLCSSLFMDYSRFIDHIEVHKSEFSIGMSDEQTASASETQALQSPPLLIPYVKIEPTTSPNNFDQMRGSTFGDASTPASVLTQRDAATVKEQNMHTSDDFPLHQAGSSVSVTANSVFKSGQILPCDLICDIFRGKKHPLHHDDVDIPSSKRQCSSNSVEAVVKCEQLQTSQEMHCAKSQLTDGTVQPATSRGRLFESFKDMLLAKNGCKLTSDSEDSDSSVPQILPEALSISSSPMNDGVGENESQDPPQDCQSETCEPDGKTPLSIPEDTAMNSSTYPHVIKLEPIEHLAHKATTNVERISITQVVSGDCAVAMVQQGVDVMNSADADTPVEQPSGSKLQSDELEQLELDNVNNMKIETSIIGHADSISNLAEADGVQTVVNMEDESAEQIKVRSVYGHDGTSIADENPCSIDSSSTIIEENGTTSQVSDNMANADKVAEVCWKEEDTQASDSEGNSGRVATTHFERSTSGECNESVNTTALEGNIDKDNRTLTIADGAGATAIDCREKVQPAILKNIQSSVTESPSNSDWAEPSDLTRVMNELDEIAKAIAGDGTDSIYHDFGDVQGDSTNSHSELADTMSTEQTLASTLQAANASTSASTGMTEEESSSTSKFDEVKNSVMRVIPVDVVCSLCSKVFDGKQAFLLHLKTHISITCPSCDSTFDDILKMYKHFDEFH